MVVVVNLFKFLFEIEKKPKKGLLAVEWVVMGYLVLTLLLILFAQTKMQNPEPMLWGRFRIVMMTIALWAVYRMIPCRFTHFCRIGAQLLLLPWWYPDTYLLNRLRTVMVASGVQRTNALKLCIVLPDDCPCDTVLFLLPL